MKWTWKKLAFGYSARKGFVKLSGTRSNLTVKRFGCYFAEALTILIIKTFCWWAYMRIEILGCSGSVMKGYNTTSILINGSILIDAGSAASVLTEACLNDIRHVFLTHTHIDHLKELPFILDPVLSRKSEGITVWGSKDTIDVLKDHIFNGLIWPNIEEIIMDATRLEFEYIQDGTRMNLGGVSVESFPVDHIPGSVGYTITEDDRYVIFSGDMGYSDDFFDMVSARGDALMALFVETSFPNRMTEMARISKHLTPEMVAKGMARGISDSSRIIAYHIKPAYFDEIISDLPSGVEHIKGGEVFVL